jgi:3-oxoadipate enol-lactonase
LPWTTANGVSLYYQVAGQNGPVVVLLHEMGGTQDSWDAVAPGLAEHYRVMRYDQRGSGLSEKVRKVYSNDEAVDDLEGVLNNLNLQPPYNFVCVAAASTQVLRFLERHPDQVKSIVLCNPAPGVDPSRAGALNERADLAEKEGMRGVMGITLDKSYPPELSDKATYEAYRGRYLGNDPVGFAHAFRMMARSNMTSLLASVTCPALVIAGRQDFIRAVAVTEGIAKEMHGARFETIDAGHFMPTTSPKALLALLQDFWK